MISLNKESQIFIVSPYLKYGGPRSLHQLCEKLINKGINASIVYFNDGNIFPGRKKIFEEYDINVNSSIIDDEKNIIIVPEAMTGVLNKYKKIRKIVWWLSYYYYGINDISWYTKIALDRRGLPKIIFPFLYMKKYTEKKKTNQEYIKSPREFSEIYHLYNSEYAYDNILLKGANKSMCHYLCGPLVDNYFNVNKEEIIKNKKDLIAYNPLKTDKTIIDCIKRQFINTKIKFVEISNMSMEEVIATLKKCKVYIDLGYHPGVERMPREAVMMYCNIITSNIGTASNNIDVPINKKYKFKPSIIKSKKISLLLRDMNDNYIKYISEFDVFRRKVEKQVLSFDKDIDEIFIMENNK